MKDLKPLPQNVNTLWASLIIDEMVKNGLNYFCLSPGYRSAPLVEAVIKNPKAEKMICMDERAAAYHALGYAKGTGKAAVLICTSGTALANYYPGLIEAKMDQVPLVVLSSDRPPELVHSEANQTIDQGKIFGEFCKFSLSLPCPQAEEDPLPWLGKVDMGLHMAHRHPMGPVHFNFPFREPLVPWDQTIPSVLGSKVQEARERSTPWTEYLEEDLAPSPSVLAKIRKYILGQERGLVVVGRLTLQEDLTAIENLVERLGCPVFYDIGSSLKHRSFHPRGEVIGDFDHPWFQQHWQREENRPQWILHLGDRVLSKNYYLMLQQYKDIQQIIVHPHPLKQDASQRANWRVVAKVSAFVQGLLEKLEPREELGKNERSRTSLLVDWSSKMRQQLVDFPFSYLFVARTLSALVPEKHILYIGNSTPVRAFESAAVGMESKRNIPVVLHRGVSGIEGFVAAAAGLVKGSQQRATLVLGDVALLHDLNSLGLLKDVEIPLIIVVVNNNSGGIFTRLPLAQFPDLLHPYISTPHPWDFYHAARQFHLDYEKVQGKQELVQVYSKALQQTRHILIEILLENDKDNEAFKKYQSIRI